MGKNAVTDKSRNSFPRAALHLAFFLAALRAAFV